ncbi:MAG: LCP family protein [Halanaerobiales bacterium]
MEKKVRNRFFIVGLILLIVISMLLIYFFKSDFWALRNNPFGSSKLNILVIGYDSSINGPPRADTIILASIDLERKEIGLLSIPRDTRVKIPGHGMNRVNASLAFGGIDLTLATLEDFLAVPIDYYVQTDFQGFARIIDAIGGVELDIKEPLKYVDRAGGVYIDLPAGRRVLNGKESLDYVRYREPVKGDIGRVERQQKFIKAMVKRVLSPDIIVKLPAIYNEIRQAVDTNIPVQDITPFMRLITEMDLRRMETVTLPGEPQYINGASYWVPDNEETKILVNNLIRSKEYIKNGQYNLRIVNGNGVPGQAAKFASKMEKYGFNIHSLANASRYDYLTTEIHYYDEANEEIAMKIKELIGGKLCFVETTEAEPVGRGEDIQIILGADNIIE